LFDFCDAAAYSGNFVEIRRGSEIAPSSVDLGGISHCALNFRGTVGSAADTWLTVFTGGPSGPTSQGNPIFDALNCIQMRADVLVSPFNNAKGAGLVALLGESGGKGLLSLLVNNGNADRLSINSIDPTTGRIVALGSGSLGGAIAQNAWYRLFFLLQAFRPPGLASAASAPDAVVLTSVQGHSNPADPNSDLVFPPLASFELELSLADLGIGTEGHVGMAGWAKSAVVDSNITNFLAFDHCP
jgi:hypothetical protein